MRKNMQESWIFTFPLKSQIPYNCSVLEHPVVYAWDITQLLYSHITAIEIFQYQIWISV